MSSGKKSQLRESAKKSNEMRISEDFYARMESDVKSLVTKMRPNSQQALSRNENNQEGSLFKASTTSNREDSKKRKRPDTKSDRQQSSEEEAKSVTDQSDNDKKKKRAKKEDFQEVVSRPVAAVAKSSSSTTAAPAATSHHYANEKTVYISGLPFTCTEEDIREFFKETGVIKSVRLPRWHDSGKLRGYGHVEFATKAAADSALDLSGQYIGDRFINVDRPMVPRAAQPQSLTATEATPSAPKPHPPGCRTIFIKNLPYDITEDEIRQHFMVYGPISNIRLAGWNHTQNLKGFGYIEYKREDSTEIAVKKNGTISIRDRRIVVDYDTAAPKGSYRNPTKDAKKVYAPQRPASSSK